MATLGVVSFSGTMATSHGNKLQLLGHSESAIINNGERREIIILRRKNNTSLAEASKAELDCGSDSINSIAETTTSTVLVSSNQAKLSKKKPSMNLPRAHHQPPPVAVARRNARERNRVKQVNNGFAILRQHIPLSVSSNYSSDSAGSGSRASRKLSKVETLRMAVDYIRSLQQLLSMDDGGNSESGAASSTSISHTQLHSPNSASSSSDTSSPSPKINTGVSPQPSPNSITSTDPRGPSSYCPSETIPIDYERTTPSVLIEDEDDDTSSFIDPASPSSSATLRSTSSGNFASPPQYHYRSALPRTSSLIQIMGNNTIGSYAHDGTGFVPLTATATLKDSTEEYLATSHHELGRLQLHQQLAATVEDAYHPEDLALLGSRLHHSPNAPTTANSLSPGVYSEQSLSPETAIASAEIPSSNIGIGISSSSTFLPAFSSALSRVSPRASALHLITSTASPIQYVSSSTLHSAAAAQHEAYPQAAPAGIELLSHVKMEMEETNGNTEDIAGGEEVVIVEGGAQGAEVIDVMSWWEQEQRLRLITAPNAPPSS